MFVLVENVFMLAVLWRPQGGAPARKRLFWLWALAQLAVLALLIVWLAVSWGRMRSWSVGEPAMPPLWPSSNATLWPPRLGEHRSGAWAIWPPLAVLAGAWPAAGPVW